MTAYFLHGTENKKIYIFSRSKNPGHVFLDFILFFNSAVEKFDKNIIWSSWSSQKRFFSKLRISRFWVQILEIH